MRALLFFALALAPATGALAAEPTAEPTVELPAEPTVEPTAEPTTDPADVAPELPRLQLEGCRQRVRAPDLDLPAARVCYETPAATDEAAAHRPPEPTAPSLVDVSAPAPPAPNRSLQRLGAFFTSGKAELLATSTGFGGYLGTLAVLDVGFALFQLLEVPAPWELQPLGAAVVLLSPIAGGAVGLALGTLAYGLWPEMTAGDANLLRSSLWLGTFNSVVLGLLAQRYGAVTLVDWWRLSGTSITTAMLAGAIGTVSGSAALALLVDLPEAAGPLGLSLGVWSGALAVLGQLMFDLPLHFEEGTLLVGAVANAGFAAGLLAAPFVPLTRFETWLLDLGAVAGGLLGTAIVLGIPAPNPVLGYGGIGLGLVLGAGAGVAIGKLVPLGLELVELPTLVAMGPLVLPPGSTGQVPIGAQVTIRLDGFPR